MAKKRTLTDVSLAKTLAVEALGSDSGYQDALKTPLAEATDPLYRDVITLHNSLRRGSQRSSPPLRARDSSMACRRFLGILDGSSQLGSHGFVDLDLTLRGGKKKLNGYLQDSFLEAIELSERSAGRWAT